MVAGRSRGPKPSIAVVIHQTSACLSRPGLPVSGMSGDKLLTCGDARPQPRPNKAMKLTGRAASACKPQAPAARPATYRRRSAS